MGEDLEDEAKKRLNKNQESLQLIKANTQKQINGIEESSLSDQEKTDAISTLKKAEEKESGKLAKLIEYPLEYYKQKIREENINKGMGVYSAISAEQMSMISRYVRQDILSKKSIDERTVSLERYVLMAKKMLDSGNLNAALAITGPLLSSEILRLTQGGLSKEAQEIYKQINDNYSDLGKLISPMWNKNNRKYCSDYETFIPPNIIWDMVYKALEAAPVRVKDDGQVATNNVFPFIVEHCGKVPNAQEGGDTKLQGEIYKEHFDLRSLDDPVNNPKFEEKRKERLDFDAALDKNCSII